MYALLRTTMRPLGIAETIRSTIADSSFCHSTTENLVCFNTIALRTSGCKRSNVCALVPNANCDKELVESI